MTVEDTLKSPTGFSIQDDEIEHLLISGKNANLLEEYFGEQEYDELRRLAKEATSSAFRGGPRIYIIPGIMGSKLGEPGRLLNNLIWIEPFSIIGGDLEKLSLKPTPSNITPMGVLLIVYLRLKLRLCRRGYDAVFHPFDWRQDIWTSGQQLAQRLKGETEPVRIVAHSMGGLVARAAVAANAPNIDRIIMLGTPNHGSFSPVMAFRGTHSVVRKVAALDLRHTAEELSKKVFSTFPGLYQMLPWPDRFDEIDLYDLKTWPSDRPRPLPAILKKALQTQNRLAPADSRFFLIAGVNQKTVVGMRIENNEFIYETSDEGDGTVPLRFAELEGAQTYYVVEEHGSLPSNKIVEKAVSDIIAEGKTTRLDDEWKPSLRGRLYFLRDSDIEIELFDNRRGGEIRSSEIRHLIDEFAAPPKSGEPTPSMDTEWTHEFKNVEVGRRRQRRIDIRLALGSITEVDARAYVLGIFRDVDPSGPARALDGLLDDLITEFTNRRMLTGNTGDVFLMPTTRYPVSADMVLFAGLGAFDRFDAETQQLTAENIIRTFIRTRTEEFATVLFGAGTGLNVAQSLENILKGFFSGLKDADTDRRFRRITICEFNDNRFALIKQELFRLASTDLFEDIEVTIDERVLPSIQRIVAGRRAAERPEIAFDPVYLIVRQERSTNANLVYRSSVLTSGPKATVISGINEVKSAEVEGVLKRLASRNFKFDNISELGEKIAALILAPEVRSILPSMVEHHFIVVHDALSSRIPWELISIDGKHPAVVAGLSRRYIADNLSVAKWLEERRRKAKLNLLLIVDPKEDLDFAVQEGDRIQKMFSADGDVKIDELRGKQATLHAVEKAFKSGKYDVVHYAGHAGFFAKYPSKSGIICYPNDVLSGDDLAGFGNLPSLVVFNACKSGRVRAARDKKSPTIREQIESNVSLAEAYLRGGIANYIGTHWSVSDPAAEKFAESFYPALLKGETISRALLNAREKLKDKEYLDWADYIHYGNPNFSLKQQSKE